MHFGRIVSRYIYQDVKVNVFNNGVGVVETKRKQDSSVLRLGFGFEAGFSFLLLGLSVGLKLFGGRRLHLNPKCWGSYQAV